MINELQKKNDELQKKNDELRELGKKIAGDFSNFTKNTKSCIDRMQIDSDEMRELSNAIISISLHQEYSKILKTAYDLNLSTVESTNQLMVCWEAQFTSEQRFRKAPKINKENTEILWEGYRQTFDKHIASGCTEAVAIRLTGNKIESDHVWMKMSKKDPKEILTRPNRITLRRQLVTNRK